MSLKIDYSLTENDFLEFQMYFSLRSKQHSSQRKKAKILTSIVLGAIGYYFAIIEAKTIGYAYLAAGTLFLIFYNRYSYWKYKRHFIKHIREHRKGLIGLTLTLELQGDQILSSSDDSDGALSVSSVENIVELETVYVVAFKQSSHIIIPKNNILSGNPEAVIKNLSQSTNLPIEDGRNLKWK